MRIHVGEGMPMERYVCQITAASEPNRRAYVLSRDDRSEYRQARTPGPDFAHTMVVLGLLFGWSAMVRRMKAFVVANEKDRGSCFCALLGMPL